MGKVIDLTHRRFGRLVAIKYLGLNVHNKAVWLCRCDCGNETEVSSGGLLKTNNTRSCGCFKKERNLVMNKTHGYSSKTEYRSWSNMIQRCTNKNFNRYNDYGGRGITVCERWKVFENFLEDMGDKPSNCHSIDRVDVNGNYELSNCKWSTKSEQTFNQRKRKNNTSGEPGVMYNTENDTWMSRIGINKQSITLGSFKNIEDAVKARKEAEIKYWGKSS